MPGLCTALRPGVRRIVAPNAGLMTGPGTNTYLLGEREVAVVDPGPQDARHLDALLAAAGPLIRWVLVTHTHRDHSPLAAELAARTGAQIIGLPPPRDGRQDANFTPGHEPHDGECLRLGDVDVTVIHTPGHASNCVCYLLASGLLITGDHVLDGVSPVILPPDGDMAAYLASIDKLFAYDFEQIAPGHGNLIDAAKQALVALRAHRMAREDKVLRHLRNLQAADIATLTPAVYDDVPEERYAWARLTLEAHLVKLAAEGRALEQDGIWQALSA